MKSIKKIAALLLALVMVLAMTTVAFADDEPADTTPDLSSHTYTAFQIFSGTQGTQTADASTLGDIDWGTGISGAAFLTALQGESTFGTGEDNAFYGCETAKDVAEVIANWSDGSDNAKKFASIAYDNKAGNGIAVEAGTDPQPAGYYLIVDTTPAADLSDENAVYNLALLQLTKKGTLEIATKVSVPSVVKKIVEANVLKDANTADIGDTVNYQFTGTMPSEIAEYDTYYYVFTDTLSKGLTFNEDITVKVDGVDVTDYFYQNSSVDDSTDVTTIKVGMADILSLKNLETPVVVDADTTVVVTYSATVNEDAIIGETGMPNTVTLEYSNNPNDDGIPSTTPPTENPPEPTTEHPTGDTPSDTTVTYSAKIVLTKVDGEGTTLTGAKFSISGISSNVKVINGEKYVLDNTNGTYYMLKNGKYTTSAPITEVTYREISLEDAMVTGAYTMNDMHEYRWRTAEEVAGFTTTPKPQVFEQVLPNTDDYDAANINNKFAKVEYINKETVQSNFVSEGWVEEDGTLSFTGLGEGTYTITELIAPTGYNLLTAPIIVVIASDVADIEAPEADTEITWTATNGATGDDEVAYTVTDGVVTFDVVNNPGSVLPETGGIGTTLFYVIGGILLAGAAVLLITKKRVAVEG